jgi:hypothetical protein
MTREGEPLPYRNRQRREYHEHRRHRRRPQFAVPAKARRKNNCHPPRRRIGKTTVIPAKAH